METPGEREQRIARLEQARSERHASMSAPGVGGGTTVWPTPDDAGTGVIPLEIAPGRGDLNYSSGFVPTFPTALSMVGNRAVSFARLYMSQPWVGTCVRRMLSWAVRVPLRVYRKTSDANARQRLLVGDHPLATAIEEPWVGGCAAELVENLLGPVLVHGNSVTEIDESAGANFSFIPKDWRFVMPMMPWRDQVVAFMVDTDIPALKREVSMDKILHVKNWSPVGPIGCSPLQQLGVTLQIEDAAQRHQRSLFTNGATPLSALTMDEAFLGIDPGKRREIETQIRADMTALYTGPENAGRPVLLPAGIDWKALGQTTVEAALIDQRRVAREEICGVYMIPPTMVGILEYAIKSNIQEQRSMVYTDCLGPPLIMLEQSINAQVTRDLLQDDQVFCEFDFSAVLRGNRLDEIASLRDAISGGMLTPNESRAVLGEPKAAQPEMDKFYMPLVNNLQALGEPAPNPNAPDGTPSAPGGGVVVPNDAGGSPDQNIPSALADRVRDDGTLAPA